MNYLYLVLLNILIIFFCNRSFAQIYIATDGIDTNPGTIEQPLKTIPAAVSMAQAGDTIFIRGGDYIMSTTITITKNGTENNRLLYGCIPERKACT